MSPAPFGFTLSDSRVLNADATGGDLDVQVTAQAGTEAEVVGILVANQELAARNLSIFIEEAGGDDILRMVFGESVAAGASRGWPDGSTGVTVNRITSRPVVINQDNVFVMRFSAVTALDDMLFAGQYRVFGRGLTFTEVVA